MLLLFLCAEGKRMRLNKLQVLAHPPDLLQSFYTRKYSPTRSFRQCNVTLHSVKRDYQSRKRAHTHFLHNYVWSDTHIDRNSLSALRSICSKLSLEHLLLCSAQIKQRKIDKKNTILTIVLWPVLYFYVLKSSGQHSIKLMI